VDNLKISYSSHTHPTSLEAHKTQGIRDLSESVYTLKENVLLSRALLKASNGYVRVYSAHLRKSIGVPELFALSLMQRHRLDVRKTKETINAIRCVLFILSQCAIEMINNGDKQNVFGFLHTANTRGCKLNSDFYGRPPFGARVCDKVIRYLIGAGLIEIKRKGSKSEYAKSNGLPGISSFYRPTDRFMFEFRRYRSEFTPSIIKPNLRLVELRSKSRLACYKETRETKYAERILKQLNQKLAGVSICIDTKLVAPALTQFTRKFKEDLSSGGRIYGHIQNRPKAERAFITFNGERCIELDYSSLHISILYHQQRIEIDCDLYQKGVLRNYHRNDVKRMCTIMLNAKTRDGAAGAFDNNTLCANKLIDAIEFEHQIISNSFYSESWRWLQKLDSDIALRVIDKLLNSYSTPIIPIHDSFIAPERMQDLLWTVMETVYKEALGYTPRITRA
jgi:hypothetical protein